jgi:hypothetical protein
MAFATEELSNHDLQHQAFIEQNIGGGSRLGNAGAGE